MHNNPMREAMAVQKKGPLFLREDDYNLTHNMTGFGHYIAQWYLYPLATYSPTHNINKNTIYTPRQENVEKKTAHFQLEMAKSWFLAAVSDKS